MTAPGLSLEFEHHERKIDRLSDSCVVLSSGDALLATEIIGRMTAPATSSVKDFATNLRDTYQAVHLERVEHVILRPRGLTWDEYKNRAAQLPLQGYLNIDQTIFNFGIGVVDFLVAGVDPSGGHVFRVHYDGIAGGSWLEWCDKIGSRATGSGSPHAAMLLSLEGQHRGLTAAETMYNVFCAKKSAELAPGVGPATDLAIIRVGGTENIPEATLVRLQDLRQKSQSREADRDAAIGRIYDERPEAKQHNPTTKYESGSMGVGESPRDAEAGGVAVSTTPAGAA